MPSLNSIKLEALSATVNGVVITDHQGQIVWVNPAFERQTGYSYDEIVGHNPRLLKSGETPVETYMDLWRTCSSGQVWNGRLRNRRKDGSVYDEEMTITPVNVEGGRTYFIAVKQDISDRVKAEKERDDTLRELAASQAGLRESLNGAFAVLADMADLTQPLLGKHGRRTAEVALKIAVHLGVAKEADRPGVLTQRDIWGAALLHDIGKSIPPPKNTIESLEFRRFGHAQRAQNLLRAVPGTEMVRSIIRHHHEAYDGSGFPSGLKGDKIPLGARIVALASAFDNCLYKYSLTVDAALERLESETGDRFDPNLVQVLASALKAQGDKSTLESYVLVGLRDLKPGMILADDIQAATGMLLFRKGVSLSDRDIIRLARFQEREAVDDAIRVVREETALAS